MCLAPPTEPHSAGRWTPVRNSSCSPWKRFSTDLSMYCAPGLAARTPVSGSEGCSAFARREPLHMQGKAFFLYRVSRRKRRCTKKGGVCTKRRDPIEIHAPRTQDFRPWHASRGEMFGEHTGLERQRRPSIERFRRSPPRCASRGSPDHGRARLCARNGSTMRQSTPAAGRSEASGMGPGVESELLRQPSRSSRACSRPPRRSRRTGTATARRRTPRRIRKRRKTTTRRSGSTSLGRTTASLK